MDNPQSHSQPANNEVNLKEVILFLKEWFHYLLSQWKILTIALAAGLLLGTAYSFFSPTKYVAKTTFVLDDPSQNGLTGGTLSSLTSVLGVGGGNSTLLTPDNIVWLYTSDRMIGESLLVIVDMNGQQESLINFLLQFEGDLKDYDKKIRKIYKNYRGFPNAPLERSKLSIDQNRVLRFAIKLIKSKHLTVSTEDHTMGIIGVNVVSGNELFSYYFTKTLVKRVNDFYIDTKTKKEQDQVSVLQKKVDEFNRNMGQSMHQAANAADAIPNANPILKSLQVTPQRKLVDVQVNSAIYTAMIQQLEAAKVTLAQETPVIQVIDNPILPLPIANKSVFFFLTLGGFLAVFLTLAFIILKHIYFRALN